MNVNAECDNGVFFNFLEYNAALSGLSAPGVRPGRPGRQAQSPES